MFVVSLPARLRESVCGKKENYKKNKKGTVSQAEQNTHIYQKEKERKNGIKDNILSRKTEHEQNTKRRRTEHNAKEEARRNVFKSDVLPRKKEKR